MGFREKINAILLYLKSRIDGPVRPGDAVGVHGGKGKIARWGTFGCVVARKAGDTPHLLTAEHVVDSNRADHLVYHVLGPGKKPAPAKLGRPVAELSFASAFLSALDCAVAVIQIDARVVPTFRRPLGRISDVVVKVDEWKFAKNEVKVQMWGAKSGHRRGYSAVGMDYEIEVRDGLPNIEPPLIEVTPDHKHGSKEGHDELVFCKPGDSGALLVTVPPKRRRPRPVGILIAKSETKFLTVGYAMPMERVMKALGPEASIVTR